MTKQEVPDTATCRTFGCGRKATTLIYDSKGRRQYCCPKHDGSQRIKERTCMTGKQESARY